MLNVQFPEMRRDIDITLMSTQFRLDQLSMRGWERKASVEYFADFHSEFCGKFKGKQASRPVLYNT